ncbi:hypothetical protein SAMN04487965_2563 [Microbulbifer donghaiensis]|uniref:DUF4382 domain-containing protein n=1 Tax=Microbulbifer donghaiensis TaxID=494016 RepID=A0A1M5E1Z8_9GAMM|nr:hypothetical protein [Microbulbifer donghaiensis]SHF73091.1 hypothetical protein SAMN04487965_2563 [Microbulbifer donghaiensis]
MNRDLFAGWRSCVALLLASILCACGSGSGGDRNGGVDSTRSSSTAEPAPICATGDNEPSSEQCGQLYIGLTDLEGDFIRYQVDVTSLRLQRFDGTWVELLPAANAVDFVQYRERTELVTAATLQLGNYVRGEITLDYSDADIRVDVDGFAERARVRFEDGARVREVTLALEFDPLRPVVVVPDIPALLQLDFNLVAANSVDTVVEPPEVTLLPAATAAANPLLLKPFRMRGPLISVDEREVSFRIALQPFYSDTERYGGVNIQISGETDWEINGERFFGASGLAALAELPADIATLAFGVFDRSTRRFITDLVYVGSSVPGDTLDTVKGHVLARRGNLVTIVGAQVIRADGSVSFRDELELLLTDTTQVTVPRFPLRQEIISGVSIGQRIAALGHWNDGLLSLDLDQGRVRLLSTTLDSFLNSRVSDEMNVTALEFGGRDALLFDYRGTSNSEDQDANPDGYQVDIGALTVPPLAVGTPLRFHGYVTSFGRAPPDFSADSLQDFSVNGAQFLVSWIPGGSDIPFLTLDAGGITVNLAPDLLGLDHTIRRGAVVTDLLSLFTVPRLQPVPEEDGGLYALAEDDIVFMYSDFSEFVIDLNDRLIDGARVQRLFAEGGWVTGGGAMTVNSVTVVLSPRL